MSRLVDAEEFYRVPVPVLRNVLTGKILRSHRRVPLHPDEIARRIYERSTLLKPVNVHKGWLLIFWDADGQKTFQDVVYVKDADGTRRPAAYADACEIRDDAMADFGYEKCWLIMKTAEDTR